MSDRPRSSQSWMGAAIAVGLFGIAVALSGRLALPPILLGPGAVGFEGGS